MQCSNNLKQIGLSMHNYESTFKRFPSGNMVGASFSVGLSVHARLLPYMEQAAMYNQVDFNNAYNHANNDVARNQRVPTFMCPSDTFSQLQLRSVVRTATTATRARTFWQVRLQR